MINKVWPDTRAVLDDVPDGAVVGIGGFGSSGVPGDLIDALVSRGARELTVVTNNAGNGETGIAALLKAGRVAKLVCSFPRAADSHLDSGADD